MPSGVWTNTAMPMYWQVLPIARKLYRHNERIKPLWRQLQRMHGMRYYRNILMILQVFIRKQKIELARII
jgi:hypothetical protein